jgi:hypothetical protein
MYTPAQPPSPTLSFFTPPTHTTPLHHHNHHDAPSDIEPAPQRFHQYHIPPQPAGSPPPWSTTQPKPVPITPVPDNITTPGHSPLRLPGYLVDRSFNPIIDPPDPPPTATMMSQAVGIQANHIVTPPIAWQSLAYHRNHPRNMTRSPLTMETTGTRYPPAATSTTSFSDLQPPWHSLTVRMTWMRNLTTTRS